MEAPWAYHYAGRPDRTAEVVHAAVNNMFGLGRGGLPGNDDSGGFELVVRLGLTRPLPDRGPEPLSDQCPVVRRVSNCLGRQRACDRCARFRRACRGWTRAVCAVSDLQRRTAESDLADRTRAASRRPPTAEARVAAVGMGHHDPTAISLRPRCRIPRGRCGRASSEHERRSIQMIIQRAASRLSRGGIRS